MVGFYDLLSGSKVGIAYRAYLRNQLYYVLTVLFFMLRFKSINFLPK